MVATVMNRRQLEDAKKLETLEAQEQALLKKLGDAPGGMDDLQADDLSNLEDDVAAEEAARAAEKEAEDKAKKSDKDPEEEARKAAEAAEAAKKAEAEKERKAAEAAKKVDPSKAEKPKEGTAEFWKSQAETWRKRKGDADRALTPAQEEAARLRREVEELKSKQAEDRFSALKQELDQLRASLATGKSAQSQMADDEAMQTEIAALKTLNPEAARLVELEGQRLNRTVESTKAEMQKELEVIRQAKVELENRRLELERNALRESHRAFVVQQHPDIDDIYSYALPALQEWAETDSPEYSAIVRDPLSVSPRMFAKVIKEFKQHASHTAEVEHDTRADEPAAGDLTTRVRRASAHTKSGATDTDILSEEELNNFEKLMQASRENPAKQEILLRRLEKTIEANPET